MTRTTRSSTPFLWLLLALVTGLATYLAQLALAAPVTLPVASTGVAQPPAVAAGGCGAVPGRSAAASAGELYRSLEALAEQAASSRWQRRVEELEAMLERERKLASAGVILPSAPAAPPAAAAAKRGAEPSRRSLAESPPPRPPRPLSTRNVKVHIQGSDALVLGEVKNPRHDDAFATVHLELLLDGRVYGQDWVQVLVPAGSTAPFQRRFATSLADGTYSARVRVE